MRAMITNPTRIKRLTSSFLRIHDFMLPGENQVPPVIKACLPFQPGRPNPGLFEKDRI
jgi:hypothetical protein